MTSSEGSSWRVGTPLSTELTPTAVIARPDGAGLVLGYLEGSLHERRARAVLVDVTGAETSVVDAPGWFVSGQAEGDSVVALRGRAGPVFDLWRSDDFGRTWRDPLPCSAASLTRVCPMGGGEVWALGAETLGRWKGDAWQSIEPPAHIDHIDPIDHTRDRLFAIAGVPVLATPKGLHLWREARQAWGHRSVDGAHVRGMSFPFIATTAADGAVRLGRLEDAWVEWLGEVKGGADVANLSFARWDGDGNRAVQLLLVPKEQGRGLVLVRSAPQGGLVTEKLAIPHASWADISGARGVLGLTLDRRPLQSGPS